MILKKEEKERLVESLSWMIESLKVEFDRTKRNEEFGSQGGYSEQLMKAINLLKDIEKIYTVETIDSHGNSKSSGHRKAVSLNCRSFKCVSNVEGLCGLVRITLESISDLHVDRVRCVQGSDEEMLVKGD